MEILRVKWEGKEFVGQKHPQEKSKKTLYEEEQCVCRRLRLFKYFRGRGENLLLPLWRI